MTYVRRRGLVCSQDDLSPYDSKKRQCHSLHESGTIFIGKPLRRRAVSNSDLGERVKILAVKAPK
jgi:hypothetical protein